MIKRLLASDDKAFIVFLAVVGGLIGWFIWTATVEQIDRRNNTFTDSGRIESIRVVKMSGYGWYEESDIYVTINGHEYRLAHSLFQEDFAYVGQGLQYTHYGNEIEDVIKIGEDARW